MPILTTLLIKAVKIALSSGNSGAAGTTGEDGLSSLGESGTPWGHDYTDGYKLPKPESSDDISDFISSIFDALF